MRQSAIRDKLESLAERYGRDLADVTELHTERAAIREHDGGLSRGDADREALGDVERILVTCGNLQERKERG